MSISSLLPPPLGFRKNIPLYYPKSEAEIKADSYEIYNPNVLRSCKNYYDGIYGETLLNQVRTYLKGRQKQNILELGCGSGYLIGNLAMDFPDSECIGLDYSYQMLKMAAQVFKGGENSLVTTIAALQNGMDDMEIENHSLNNLTYALSDACVTPLQDQSIDFCFSCFLWDRVADPKKLLEEKIRVTKPDGQIVILSPFNYLSAKGWQQWHPTSKVIELAETLGLKLSSHDHLELEELLDIRNNKVVWNVECLVFDNDVEYVQSATLT